MQLLLVACHHGGIEGVETCVQGYPPKGKVSYDTQYKNAIKFMYAFPTNTWTFSILIVICIVLKRYFESIFIYIGFVGQPTVVLTPSWSIAIVRCKWWRALALYRYLHRYGGTCNIWSSVSPGCKFITKSLLHWSKYEKQMFWQITVLDYSTDWYISGSPWRLAIPRGCPCCWTN